MILATRGHPKNLGERECAERLSSPARRWRATRRPGAGRNFSYCSPKQRAIGPEVTLSKPLSLALPDGAAAVTLDIAIGPLAALDARPSQENEHGRALTTALLVPGFTGSKEDFLPVLGALAASGRRVVAYDQRGQYESKGPEDPAAYTCTALADELLAVIDALGGPVHLVGHSFGGLVARDALIKRPEVARSLTLLDSGPAALGGQRRMWLELMAPVINDSGLAGVYAAMEALNASDEKMQSLPQATRDFLKKRFLSQSATCVLVSGQAVLEEPDRVDELRAAYPGPILVAWGEHDDAWSPAEQEDMANRLGVPFEVIPDAVHSPAVENPDATAKVLSAFWAANE
jgi:pimeloyl-ACP methyl ester carboxylesterase